MTHDQMMGIALVVALLAFVAVMTWIMARSIDRVDRGTDDGWNWDRELSKVAMTTGAGTIAKQEPIAELGARKPPTWHVWKVGPMWFAQHSRTGKRLYSDTGIVWRHVSNGMLADYRLSVRLEARVCRLKLEGRTR